MLLLVLLLDIAFSKSLYMIFELGVAVDLFSRQGRRTCCFVPLDCQLRDRLANLGLVRRRRGCRAGRKANGRRRVPTVSETDTGKIPVVLTDRQQCSVNGSGPVLCCRHRDSRRRILRTFRRASPPLNVGVFNARSVRNKAACIASWIADERLSCAAIIETWHDGHDDPSLIAFAPAGYDYVEQARPRPQSASDMTINHGGVCLFYRGEFTVRRVNLAEYKTMEYVCVLVHGSSVNLLVMVVY